VTSTLRTLSARLETDRQSNSRPPQHFDEGVNAEPLDSPAYEVAHAGLSDAEDPSCFGLCETAFLDQLLDGHHEARAHSQVLGLAGWKTDIEEHVA
jgi:hypothetical protein